MRAGMPAAASAGERLFDKGLAELAQRVPYILGGGDVEVDRKEAVAPPPRPRDAARQAADAADAADAALATRLASRVTTTVGGSVGLTTLGACGLPQLTRHRTHRQHAGRLGVNVRHAPWRSAVAVATQPAALAHVQKPTCPLVAQAIALQAPARVRRGNPAALARELARRRAVGAPATSSHRPLAAARLLLRCRGH